MTAGQRRYAEMIAIRLAVEITAGQSRCKPFGDAHLLSVAPAEGDRVRRVFGGEDVFGARRSGWWVASG
jgi:hypothetical protein